MRTPVWQPGVDRIAALARQPTDLVSLWQDATGVIANFVPHYMTPCWYTVDPASLLITSHVQEGLAEFPAEWLAGEYYNEDVNQINDVLRSTSGLSTLHEASGGDPSAGRYGCASGRAPGGRPPRTSAAPGGFSLLES